MKKKIFIIGTGRSGTHWLGHILEASPEIKVNIENYPIFNWVTQAAINYKKRKRLLPFIISYYNLMPLFTNKHFAEKSHPNLWLVEYLEKYVSNSYFIGVIRNPHATVSSMLLHDGVMKWIYEWSKYPVPNNFLGITENNIEVYKKMEIEAKCTMRWMSHKNHLEKLKYHYPDKFLIINYDDLFTDTDEQLQRISNFIRLKNNLPKPDIKLESKDKWKVNLSKDQIKIINETLRLKTNV